MDMNRFAGIFPALLTPFGKDGKINEKELARLVEYNVKKGVRGFYVCGSTGEAFLLSTEERKEVMRVVKETAPHSTLIAHIGSLNEADAISLGKHAKELGYDAVSSVAPYYYKFSFEEIKGYYTRLADASELPMLVYHIPLFSGVSMGMKEMRVFLEDDRFMGIKYTSNDYFTLEQCKSAFPDKIVYNGYDEMLSAGLAMGADGGIGSTYNFMAEKFVKIYELFRENRLEEARAVQKEANRIITLLCRFGVMQAEKEVLNQLGFDFGECRPPFAPLSEEAKAVIAKEIVEKL